MSSTLSSCKPQSLENRDEHIIFETIGIQMKIDYKAVWNMSDHSRILKNIQRRKWSAPNTIKSTHGGKCINIVKVHVPLVFNHGMEHFNLFMDCLNKMGRLNWLRNLIGYNNSLSGYIFVKQLVPTSLPVFNLNVLHFVSHSSNSGWHLTVPRIFYNKEHKQYKMMTRDHSCDPVLHGFVRNR